MSIESQLFENHRFSRLLKNEMLETFPRVLIATAATLGLLLFIQFFFPSGLGVLSLDSALLMILFFSGTLLTASVCRDLHHPIKQFQYLSLPCSNLERYASKYLISGPLYLLYSVLIYNLFQFLSPFLLAMFSSGDDMGSNIDEQGFVIQFFFSYLFLHGFLLLGALFFRINAIAKTVLALCFILVSLICTWTLSLKLVCGSCFDSTLSFNLNSVGSDRFLEPLADLLISFPQLFIGFFLILYMRVVYLGYMFIVDYET